MLTCRIVVAGTFLLSLAGKVRGRKAYEEFSRSVATLSMVPGRWVRPAAMGVIAAEATAALLVALPFRTAPVGFGVAIGLLTVFTAVIVRAMLSGDRVPCRCFGASVTPLGLPHVIRNLALLAAAITGYIGFESAAQSRLSTGGVLVSVAAAAVAGLFAVRIDDVVALVRPERMTGAR
ncbi:hypothetical protein E1292_17530 [Nonomuraea deserti]|uniref:Methylamine utilisation protein MauE domain-containing protein n=1 Tax=Nonomuraea deserti TaxID=1848322 RepID=A0A4R4VHW2_9ACTN|nr:MauE/DoxX family redox-associated membrane protein [Nonomuraea deserti]TDD05259.1 hypothetical protein E1292_17530 [Nonomuraea deserti]